MFLSGFNASSLSAIAIPVCQLGTTKDQCALLALLISKFPHKTFSFLVQLKKLLQCKFKIPLYATIHFSFCPSSSICKDSLSMQDGYLKQVV